MPPTIIPYVTLPYQRGPTPDAERTRQPARPTLFLLSAFVRRSVCWQKGEGGFARQRFFPKNFFVRSGSPPVQALLCVKRANHAGSNNIRYMIGDKSIVVASST